MSRALRHAVLFAALVSFGHGSAAVAGGDAARDKQDRFLALYRELVETDTSLSSGSCTLAAERMAARLAAAGYSTADSRVIVPSGFARQGNLVARIPGTDAKLPAILLLAHIDVVEAKASDWKRDPFTLIEENGYFHARGVVDDKAMAAAFVDAFIRYREEHGRFSSKEELKKVPSIGESRYKKMADKITL